MAQSGHLFCTAECPLSGVKRIGRSARRCAIQGRRNMRAKDAKRRSGKAAWVAIDLFRRLEPDWKSTVGKETLDDGGCNGNRILGDRRNYRVRDRLRRCSEPSETQRGAALFCALDVWRPSTISVSSTSLGGQIP